MGRKGRPICSITFNQMSIPVYNLEQGKKALNGIFMIGETIAVEESVRKRMARKRAVTKKAPVRRKGSRAEKTEARRVQVGKLFDKGLNRSQIMKETGASFVTIMKDLEALGKGKKTRARGKAKTMKQVKVKRVKKVTKGPKRVQQERPAGEQGGAKG